MSKKKEINPSEMTTSAGGAHAINKFRIGDVIMMAVIVILCATCVLPFIHVAAKSISGATIIGQIPVVFKIPYIVFSILNFSF